MTESLRRYPRPVSGTVRPVRPLLLAGLTALLSALMAGGSAHTARAQGILSGDVSGDHFGAALRAIGDFNGDGFADFAIGAPQSDDGGANRGRVYVWFGQGENLPGPADLILSVGNAGDQFGFALAGIGHFNNDSYDDLAVGAPYNDTGGADRGRVYIFYGGPSPDATADLALGGTASGEHFGWSLDGSFDFNRDGRSDLVVGSPDRSTNGLQSGAASLFLGGTNPSTTAIKTWPGVQAQDWLGAAVAGAGDLNGDQYDDLVLGAPQPFALNPGRVYLVPGGSTPPDLSEATVIAGEGAGDLFGWSVAGGGDLNDDGHADVVVGAPRHDEGALNAGAVYAFRGQAGATIEEVAAGSVFGRASGDELGTSVSIAGDWTGDGRADLAAGAPGSDDGGQRAGEVDLWPGAATIKDEGRQVFSGPRFLPGFAAEDEFGRAVDFVDYNGDGRAELLAGSPSGNLEAGDEAGLASLDFPPGTLVPVRRLDVHVAASGGQVMLEWRVEDDGDLLGFQVDRRLDGAEWNRLTTGLLSEITGRYHFEDRAVDLRGGGAIEYRLEAVTRNGGVERFGPFALANAPAGRPRLGPACPNPAPSGIQIPVDLPEGGPLALTVFDAAGRAVRRLFSGEVPAGRTEFWWDGRDDHGTRLPAGRYYYRMEHASVIESRPVIVLR